MVKRYPPRPTDTTAPSPPSTITTPPAHAEFDAFNTATEVPNTLQVPPSTNVLVNDIESQTQTQGPTVLCSIIQSSPRSDRILSKFNDICPLVTVFTMSLIVLLSARHALWHFQWMLACGIISLVAAMLFYNRVLRVRERSIGTLIVFGFIMNTSLMFGGYWLAMPVRRMMTADDQLQPDMGHAGTSHNGMYPPFVSGTRTPFNFLPPYAKL